VSQVTTAQDQDVVELLLDQHDQIRSLFSQVSTAQGTTKRELFEELVRLLAVHESAEEEVVHPTARRKMESGDQVIDSRLHEENEAKHALAELYDMGVDNPQFDAKFAELSNAVNQHAMHEETEEFPYLRQNVPAEQLRRMAGAVRAAETMAPTRPHPRAGESMAANMIAGPPLAMFDRMRDAVRDWRQKSG
jgi:2-oxoglutarate dehydrogenase complex dehydrogenase (E1) component-like enzyme